eukprot:CAMPEP_0181334154 /NCGR_PEP_ID=MMETSP1101-20121128/26091_1 /TAXON_ID=46948 /ORGANISM="Rhodomonas abbreviata, Strain Caron Lab Isolate" /LENGTH=377 /DNA_ID=CAMNT_0023444077 /DNA_START=173 /DNA_END=1303 /DNA_ORIENTATION=-
MTNMTNGTNITDHTWVQANVTCECLDGYESIVVNGTEGTGLVGECMDIDECETTCLNSNLSTCHNENGSYTCTCHPGYEMSEDEMDVCVDVDECEEEGVCPFDTTCHNTNGSFYCECHPGYRFKPEMNMTTGPTTTTTVVPTTTSSSATATPTTSTTSALYNTTTGTTPMTTPMGNMTMPEMTNATHEEEDLGPAACEDIDECENDMHLCGNFSICTNTIGSFVCTCEDEDNFPWEEGKPCNAANECMDRSVCKQRVSVPPLYDTEIPAGICTDTRYGYNCSCENGFTAEMDALYEYTDEILPFLCVDVDECMDMHACADVPHTACSNTFGSFTCICTEGWTTGEDDECVDVDECDEDELANNCDEHAVCQNTMGSF